jgi:hypothetical protein
MENLGKNGWKTREIYGKPREWRPWVAFPKWENQKRKEKTVENRNMESELRWKIRKISIQLSNFEIYMLGWKDGSSLN